MCFSCEIHKIADYWNTVGDEEWGDTNVSEETKNIRIAYITGVLHSLELVDRAFTKVVANKSPAEAFIDATGEMIGKFEGMHDIGKA